ncbi:hypothetical protein BOX15_Mlig012932g3 [Macrostomum lignano]|uniref:DNA-directed DNA polymerase n=1 Tax=Macrostomum lignano TaxID=282301 RepID=A0A267GFF3_9PLAT|nr:hypothetical protein BOX15_Mlig012932g3 [Macrostomum lignano]
MSGELYSHHVLGLYLERTRVWPDDGGATRRRRRRRLHSNAKASHGGGFTRGGQSILSFSAYETRLPPLYLVYADIESLLVPVEKASRGLVKGLPVPTANSRVLQIHVPVCVAFRLVVDPDLDSVTREDLLSRYNTPCKLFYSTPGTTDCIGRFLLALRELAFEVTNATSKMTYRPMLRKYLGQRPSADRCYVCRREFSADESQVWDHCHLSGLPRGMACMSCNRKLALQRYRIIVYLHNLRGYDGKIIVREVYNVFSGEDDVQLHVLPESRERFKTFSLKFKVPLLVGSQRPQQQKQKKKNFVWFEICFKDTFAYLSTSLASLANRLTQEQLVHCRDLLNVYPKLQLSTLQQKGVFPYCYLDSEEKLDSVTELPSRDLFYDAMTRQECSKEEYTRAQQSWQEFDCANLRDYLTAYLLLDVLLLCDVFESFRRTAIREYGLDVCHFLGSPMYSLAACLLKVKKPIELFTDARMYSEVEASIRGGFSFGTRHLTTANNPMVEECRRQLDDDDDNLRELRRNAPYGTHLAYLDANSLYASCMVQALPYKAYRWLPREVIENLSVDDEAAELENPNKSSKFLAWLSSYCSNGRGALLNVDLYYPKFLHDSTADLPLAIGHERIDSAYLTEHMKQDWVCLQRQLDPRKRNAEVYEDVKRFTSPTRKLIGSVTHKTGYIVHHRALRLYLELGMRVTRVNRVLEFVEGPILQEYIEHNIRRRSEATSDFDRDFFKLLNNAVYGKFLQRVRDRLSYRMCTTAEKLETYVAKEEFMDVILYTDRLAGVSLTPRRVLLNKPILIGSAILDLAKTFVYEFFYSRIQCHRSLASARVLGGDTDSLILALVMADPETSPQETLFKDLVECGVLDTSNYPPSHPLYTTKYKGKLMAWKDEVSGCTLLEFAFLRPKNYSMVYAKESLCQIVRCKGVSKSIVRGMKHNVFLSVLKDRVLEHVTMRTITSRRQKIYLLEQRKQALSFFDTKRAWLDPYSSLPFGHWRLT